MPKREEIRKGLRNLIDDCYGAKNPDYPKLTAFQPIKFLNELFPYLHSEGVVIKKEELPILTKKGEYYLTEPIIKE